MSDVTALLRMIRREGDQPATEPERTEPEVPEPASVPLPLILAATPHTEPGLARRILMKVREWPASIRRQVNEKRQQDGGIAAFLDNGHAPTMAQQREYADRRNWVHPGDEGGVCEKAGVAYYGTLGKAGPALCNGIGWIFGRMLRAAIAGSLAYLLAIVAVFAFIGTAAGLLMIVAFAALIGAGWGLLELWAAASRKAAELRNPAPAADGGDDATADEEPEN